MSLNRFEDLKRFLYISPTKQLNSEDSDDEAPEAVDIINIELIIRSS